ncbi:MAG TPA: hypothetical protein VH136_06080 [Trebonia sp.]|nr:hypothetical protein [Trebonia sp.]
MTPPQRPARILGHGLVVNGVPAMVAGEKTGELAGCVLRSGRDTGTVANSGVSPAGG